MTFSDQSWKKWPSGIPVLLIHFTKSRKLFACYQYSNSLINFSFSQQKSVTFRDFMWPISKNRDFPGFPWLVATLDLHLFVITWRIYLSNVKSYSFCVTSTIINGLSGLKNFRQSSGGFWSVTYSHLRLPMSWITLKIRGLAALITRGDEHLNLPYTSGIVMKRVKALCRKRMMLSKGGIRDSRLPLMPSPKHFHFLRHSTESRQQQK